MKKRVTFRTGERLPFADYVALLRRTDLGRRCPPGYFREQISRLLTTVNEVVTARNGDRLVGVCMDPSDYAY